MFLGDAMAAVVHGVEEVGSLGHPVELTAALERHAG
jgi:hypothetical protein